LYPTSFRREYGESMLQLFNDQRRSARGAGGYAMLWLKTLRDLVRSVPAARLSERSGVPSQGAAFVWIALLTLGVVFLLNSMVLPSMVGRTPSIDVVVETSSVTPIEDYRAFARVAASAVSTFLAFGAFLLAARQRSLLTGAATFVAGAALTFMVLAMLPWLWLPLNQYPPAIAWALGIWPLTAIIWAAWLIVRRRQRPA
jgi:hypothetical protein